MNLLLTIALAWTALAIPVALVVGRALRLADEAPAVRCPCCDDQPAPVAVTAA